MDLDLYARNGQDVTVQDGRVVADWNSSGPDGNELITITPASSPALKAGTYYIGIGVFTTGVSATATLTATVNTGTSGDSGGPVQLTSGARQAFSFPAVDLPQIFGGAKSMVIDVPEGATGLDVQLSTTTVGADVDLFLRRGQEVTVSGGRPVADFSSAGDGGNERVTITPDSSGALPAGRYYISLGVYTTGVAVSGYVTATVTRASTSAPTDATVLTPGAPAKFSFPAATQPTLYHGSRGYVVRVPEGATRLRIQLASDNQTDVDLYTRFAQDVEVNNGEVVADWSSETDATRESIEITPSSNPPLRAGVYYIAVGVYSTGRPATGSISATVETGGSTGGGFTGQVLTSGVAANFQLPSVTAPTLVGGNASYRVDVPAGASKLEIWLQGQRADVDVDLYARFGKEVEVQNGGIVSDYHSASDGSTEHLIINSPSAGSYYISIAIWSTGVAATGTIRADVTTTKGLELTKLPFEASRDTTIAPLQQKETRLIGLPLEVDDEASKSSIIDRGELRKQPQALRKRLPVVGQSQ